MGSDEVVGTCRETREERQAREAPKVLRDALTAHVMAAGRQVTAERELRSARNALERAERELAEAVAAEATAWDAVTKARATTIAGGAT
jgi:hypothetical protein